jgi:Leucine-rich repeat (LRR) protein
MQKFVLEDRYTQLPDCLRSYKNIISAEDLSYKYNYKYEVNCESKSSPLGIEIKTCRQYKTSNNGYLSLDGCCGANEYCGGWCGVGPPSYYPLITQIQIPNNVTKLSCKNNKWTCLPELPPNLIYLNCRKNQLTSLPKLQNGLTYLDCAKNELTSLPPLPDGLIYLDCESNDLASLPKIPESLEVLICNSKLSDSPEIPKSLKYLVIRPYCKVNWD